MTHMKIDERGFSLIELMIALVILLVIMASIFQVINASTQRASAEQTKLDMFQEAREFMDQMSRDLRQAGNPNPRDLSLNVFTQSPIYNDLHAAAGLVNVDTGELWFEGDVDGSGTVSSIRYHLEPTGTNCPCLQRSQLPKVNGDPYITGTGGQTTPVYNVEVQGVQNTLSNPIVPIFTAYSNGTALGNPVTISASSGQTMATVDTIQVVLTVQSSMIDPQTNTYPITTLTSTVRINNCSQAANGASMSCQ
jgi:prepilin-type N-terminal cleavage/methylation domain-containing protein